MFVASLLNEEDLIWHGYVMFGMLKCTKQQEEIQNLIGEMNKIPIQMNMVFGYNVCEFPKKKVILFFSKFQKVTEILKTHFCFEKSEFQFRSLDKNKNQFRFF